ncbi:MAG: hypothetical protein HQK52_22925 [Oligoflexia bacterium]|nr:hypothetical protein [Oligoflexia bacterium]
MNKKISICLIVVTMTIMATMMYSSSAYAFSWKFPFFDFLRSKHQLAEINKLTPSSIPMVKPPLNVKIGVYVLHVGKYDLQGATYEMDFYLLFECRPACNTLDFEIMNATKVNSLKVRNEEGTLVYRVRAELNKINNLHNYPFDAHTLDIVIEDKHLTSDKIIFEVNPSKTALDSQLNVVGFDLSHDWRATVNNHYYETFQRISPRYTFSIDIQRPMLAGFLKGILPALIIIFCNFLALFIRIDHITQRLGVVTSTLIASVVFHLNLTNSIPPLGHITYADTFMFINYISLFSVFIEVIMTMYFMDSKHKNIARISNKISIWIIPLLWLLLQIFCWFDYNPRKSIVESSDLQHPTSTKIDYTRSPLSID